MNKLRFAVLGTGFWANYQIPAWMEVGGVDLVAVCDRNRAKAEALAARFQLPNVYDNLEAMVRSETLDFVDIITDVDTHPQLVMLAAAMGIDVICQKPMAPSLELAQQMVSTCQQRGVKFFVHENFRWQAPIRALKKVLDAGRIGRPFRGKVSFVSAFPVFDNQPNLATLDKFILADMGSHILDICRFLFGEAKTLYSLTQRVNPKILGEDVAQVLMKMESGLHCFAEMSYASLLEQEAFPQTLILVEGENGSIHLSHDFVLKITTREGTVSEKINPEIYNWLNPDYAVVHSSMVACNRNILNGLQNKGCETTGEDNLKTVQLVWAAYESAASQQVVVL